MNITTDGERLTQLIEALKIGWEIDQPVLLGATWRDTQGGKDGIYHFILKNKIKNKTTMLSLLPSPELMVFLHENNLSINPIQ